MSTTHITELITIDELAERWHCGHLFIRRAIRRGDLRSVRLGRVIRIIETDAERYIEERTTGSASVDDVAGSLGDVGARDT